MKKIAFILVIFALGSTSVFAKVEKFVWSDEICTYESFYEARVYTKKQLEDTYRLWSSRDFELDAYQGLIETGNGLRDFQPLASLDAEYTRKSADLRKLEVVNVPFWKDFKQRKMTELDQNYRLARAMTEADQNPSALLKIEFADACVRKFAPPLIAGGEPFLKLLGEFYQNPETETSSPETLKEARKEILSRGFWSCAVERIKRPPNSLAVNHFRHLFQRVRQLGCDYA